MIGANRSGVFLHLMPILSAIMALLKCLGTSGLLLIIMVPKKILEVPENAKREYILNENPIVKFGHKLFYIFYSFKRVF